MTGNSERHEGGVPRSKDMVLVGYFLSRCGRGSPPPQLGNMTWGHAYFAFFKALSAGRSRYAFRNSLKHTRDTYDGYFPESGRKGWRDETGAPKPLTELEAAIFEEWRGRADEDLWGAVRHLAELDLAEVPMSVIDDLEVELEEDDEEHETRTEGKQRVVISRRAERDPKLRAKALKAARHRCAVCDFHFEEWYGEWGKDFAEVHHVRPLGGETEGVRETDSAKDLVVLCANCHRMIHRRRGITLTVEELRGKLIRRRSRRE